MVRPFKSAWSRITESHAAFRSAKCINITINIVRPPSRSTLADLDTVSPLDEHIASFRLETVHNQRHSNELRCLCVKLSLTSAAVAFCSAHFTGSLFLDLPSSSSGPQRPTSAPSHLSIYRCSRIRECVCSFVTRTTPLLAASVLLASLQSK